MLLSGRDVEIYISLLLNADEMMYWVTTNNPMVEMASLNGNGRVVLLNESKAEYTGIALYNGCLYISDKTRRYSLHVMDEMASGWPILNLYACLTLYSNAEGIWTSC